MRIPAVILLCLSCFIQAGTREPIDRSWSDQDVHLRMAMIQSPGSQTQSADLISGSSTIKNPGIGLLLSAAVPGFGEMYANSWIKGVVFLGAEVTLWIGYNHYTKEGDRLDKKFRAFADAHWSEQSYWLNMVYLVKNDPDAEIQWERLSEAEIDESNYKEYLDGADGLRAYEQTQGSHSLHVVKDQQYYEMVGKYDQFRAGWEDAETSDERVTPLRAHYEDMEFKTDSEYKKAGTCAMILLANHVISALDAVWTVSRYNQRQIKIKPGMGLMPVQNTIQPVFTMQVSW